MKFTVDELKIFKKMLGSMDANDEVKFGMTLHKKQPHFCNIIGQVKIDSRCLKAHRFCLLFCSLALDHGERTIGEDIDSFPEAVFHNVTSMIV